MKRRVTQKKKSIDEKIDDLTTMLDELAMMMAKGFLALQTEFRSEFARLEERMESSFQMIRHDILGLHDKYSDHELRINAVEKKIGI